MKPLTACETLELVEFADGPVSFIRHYVFYDNEKYTFDPGIQETCFAENWQPCEDSTEMLRRLVG